jgi:hypothetical protein
MFTGVLVILLAAGCVERELTINTQPQGAVVTLNDEEIETLNTHKELKGPWYDHFPFDFFAQIVSPKRTVDKYEWTFALEEKKQVNPQELVEKAQQLRKKLQ